MSFVVVRDFTVQDVGDFRRGQLIDDPAAVLLNECRESTMEFGDSNPWKKFIFGSPDEAFARTWIQMIEIGANPIPQWFNLHAFLSNLRVVPATLIERRVPISRQIFELIKSEGWKPYYW